MAEIVLDSAILQKFKHRDGRTLDSLPKHVDPNTNIRYVLWSDIQHSFADAYRVERRVENYSRVFFMVNECHQVYVARNALALSILRLKLTMHCLEQ